MPVPCHATVTGVSRVATRKGVQARCDVIATGTWWDGDAPAGGCRAFALHLPSPKESRWSLRLAWTA